jgi:hypothetical protein
MTDYANASERQAAGIGTLQGVLCSLDIHEETEPYAIALVESINELERQDGGSMVLSAIIAALCNRSFGRTGFLANARDDGQIDLNYIVPGVVRQIIAGYFEE